MSFIWTVPVMPTLKESHKCLHGNIHLIGSFNNDLQIYPPGLTAEPWPLVPAPHSTGFTCGNWSFLMVSTWCPRPTCDVSDWMSNCLAIYSNFSLADVALNYFAYSATRFPKIDADFSSIRDHKTAFNIWLTMNRLDVPKYPNALKEYVPRKTIWLRRSNLS